MQDDQKTEIEERVTEAVETTPEGVLDFMWGKPFEILILGIQKILNLSREQANFVRTSSQLLLLRLKTEEEILADLLNENFNEELAVKALYLIDTEILKRAQNIATMYQEEIAEQAEKNELLGKTKPSDNLSETLANLSSRLSQTAIISPSKRNYSAPKIGGDSEKIKIDPYLEQIDD